MGAFSVDSKYQKHRYFYQIELYFIPESVSRYIDQHWSNKVDYRSEKWTNNRPWKSRWFHSQKETLISGSTCWRMTWSIDPSHTQMWIPPNVTEGVIPKCESHRMPLKVSYPNVNPTECHWSCHTQMWIPPNVTEIVIPKCESCWVPLKLSYPNVNPIEVVIPKCESHWMSLKLYYTQMGILLNVSYKNDLVHRSFAYPNVNAAECHWRCHNQMGILLKL